MRNLNICIVQILLVQTSLVFSLEAGGDWVRMHDVRGTDGAHGALDWSSQSSPAGHRSAVSFSGTSLQGRRHPEERAIAMTFLPSKASGCYYPLVLRNLAKDVLYHLEVEVVKVPSDGGETLFLDKRLFSVSEELQEGSAVPQIVLLQMTEGIAGLFVVEALLVDEFSGLTMEEAFLGHIKTSFLIEDPPLACQSAPSSDQLEKLGTVHSHPIIMARTGLLSDEQGPLALAIPIHFRSGHSLQKSVTVTFVSLHLKSSALCEKSQKHGPACGNESQHLSESSSSFFSVSSPFQQDSGFDAHGHVEAMVRLPRRLWQVGMYEVTLEFTVNETNFALSLVSQTQALRIEAAAASFFRQRDAGWCDIVSGQNLTSRLRKAAVPPETRRTTLVTGFWSPKSMRVNKRGEDEYWQWIQNLWNVAAPVIFVTSAQLVPRLLASGNWSAGPRCIKVLDINDFHMHALKDPLEHMVAKDREASMYSVEYSMIMHEKVHILASAAAENPFATDYFLWLDAGIDRAVGIHVSHSGQTSVGMKIPMGVLSGQQWPRHIPTALAEDRILVLDLFGSVTQFLLKQNERPETEPNITAIIEMATDLSVPPAQGLMGGIFGGSSRAIGLLNESYYPMLRSFLQHQAQCMTENVILSSLACCSKDAQRLFSLVTPFWEDKGRLYFFLLHYLAGELRWSEELMHQHGDSMLPITSLWSESSTFPNFAGVHVTGVRFFGYAGGLQHIHRWQQTWDTEILNMSDICSSSPLLSDPLNARTPDCRMALELPDVYNLILRVCALKSMSRENLKTNSSSMYADPAYVAFAADLRRFALLEPATFKVVDCEKLPPAFSSPLNGKAPCDPFRVVYLPPSHPPEWFDAVELHILSLLSGNFKSTPKTMSHESISVPDIIYAHLQDTVRHRMLGVSVQWMDLTGVKKIGLVPGIDSQSNAEPSYLKGNIVSIWSSECKYPVFHTQGRLLPRNWKLQLLCGNDDCVSQTHSTQSDRLQAKRLMFDELCGKTELHFLAEPTAQIRLKLIFGTHFREVFDLVLRICAMSSSKTNDSTWFVDPSYTLLAHHIRPATSQSSTKIHVLNCSTFLSAIKGSWKGSACDSFRVAFVPGLEHSQAWIQALQVRLRQKLEGDLHPSLKHTMEPASDSTVVESLLSSLFDVSEVNWIHVKVGLNAQLSYFDTRTSCNVETYAIVHPIYHCSVSCEPSHMVWGAEEGLPPGEMRAVRARNAGDSIQSLAAVRFLPALDVILDRLIWGRVPSGDYLPGFSGEGVLTIMNGFYGDPSSLGAVWPPPAYVKPVMLGMHFAPGFESMWKASKSWLKQHGPVGCRDPATVKLMSHLGVEAFDSGCLTLSLKRVFPTQKPREQVWVVDPSSLQEVTDLHNFSTRSHVSSKFCDDFLREESADYRIAWTIGQRNEILKVLDFVNEYSEAKVLITSRLHAALPASTRGTPVVFLRNHSTVTKHNIKLLDNNLDNPACQSRLSGIDDMFFTPVDLKPGGRLGHVFHHQQPSPSFAQKQNDDEERIKALLSEQLKILSTFKGLEQYMKTMDTPKHLLDDRSLSSFTEMNNLSVERLNLSLKSLNLLNERKRAVPTHPNQRSSASNYDRYPAVFDLVAKLKQDGHDAAPKILSFGTSVGAEVHTLAHKYFPKSIIVGVDIDEGNLNKARSLNAGIAGRVHFFNSAVWPLDTLGEYDIIFANSVLCMHPPPDDFRMVYPFEVFEKTLEQLDAVLRPSGLLILINANYRIEDTSVARLYSSAHSEVGRPVSNPEGKICMNFVPLFDASGNALPVRDLCVYRKVATHNALTMCGTTMWAQKEGGVVGEIGSGIEDEVIRGQEWVQGDGERRGGTKKALHNPKNRGPRIAVVLRGVAAAHYHHYSRGRINVDWRQTAADLHENLIQALNADLFFHAWRGQDDEYLDTEEELNSFFKPVRSEVEPLRRWDWRFNWLIQDENMNCNFCNNFSASEWIERGYSTDSIKFDWGSRWLCDAGYKWNGSSCEQHSHGRALCNRSDVRHFCNRDKLNNQHSFYYSWQRSVQLMRDHEDSSGFRYDLVIIARFDMIFAIKVDAYKALDALTHGKQLFREAVVKRAPPEKGYIDGYWGGGKIGGPRMRERWFDLVMAGTSDAVYKCGQGFDFLIHPHRLFTYDSLDSHLTAAYACAAMGIVCESDNSTQSSKCGSLLEYLPEMPLGYESDILRLKYDS